MLRGAVGVDERQGGGEGAHLDELENGARLDRVASLGTTTDAVSVISHQGCEHGWWRGVILRSAGEW